MFNIHRWKINRITRKIKAMQAGRVSSQPTDATLKKEIKLYSELADLYKKVIGNKKFPYAEIMMVECYRMAATLDDSVSHYLLGQKLIEEAKYRQNLQNEGIFNSPENLQRSQQLYEEGHVYLLASEKLGNIAAKRLRGLCIINGWGKDIDKEAGFDLIVESIEQEGCWDKVPQLFASMGLNKPEFFSAVMQRRKGH